MAVRTLGCLMFLVTGCSPGFGGNTGITVQYVLEMNFEELEAVGDDPLRPETRKKAVDQTVNVLNKRIRDFGIRGAKIQVNGNRLEIHVAGIAEEKREAFEKLLLTPGILEFRLVHEQNDRLVRKLFTDNISPSGYRVVNIEGGKFYERDPDDKAERERDDSKRNVADTGRISPLYELMLDAETLEEGRKVFIPYYVDIRPLLDGTAIKSAHPDYDEYGRVQVAMSMTVEGSKQFFKITRDYTPGGEENPGEIGRLLAIVMDDQLLVAPRLNAPIPSGSAVISGDFAYKEAELISDALNSGALPVSLRIVSQETQGTQP